MTNVNLNSYVKTNLPMFYFKLLFIILFYFWSKICKQILDVKT